MQEKEIWKDVPVYEGMYQASNLGRVRSVKRVATRINGVPVIYKGKVLSPGPDGHGYLQVNLCKNNIHKSTKVHKIVAMAFLNHEPLGDSLVVDHVNFIRVDNRLSNLRLITQRENTNQKHIKSNSIYTGVRVATIGKNWRASIWLNGRRLHLGLFNTEYEAHLAYQNKLKEILSTAYNEE